MSGKTLTFDDDGKPVEVTPGPHKLNVRRGAISFTTEEFTVAKSGEVAIRVTWRDGDLLATADGATIGRGGAKTPGDGIKSIKGGITLDRKFETSKDTIDAIAFSPAGKYLFFGGGEMLLYQLDVSTGAVLRKIPVGDYLRGLQALPDGRRVISAQYRGGITMWNLVSRQVERQFVGHTDRVYAINVSSDGRRLLSGATDGLVRLWNVESGEAIRSFHDGYCMSVA